MINYLLYKIGYWVVMHLPLKFSYALAVFLSDLHYIFADKDRKYTAGNLKAIFPDKTDRILLDKPSDCIGKDVGLLKYLFLHIVPKTAFLRIVNRPLDPVDLAICRHPCMIDRYSSGAEIHQVPVLKKNHVCGIVKDRCHI